MSEWRVAANVWLGALRVRGGLFVSLGLHQSTPQKLKGSQPWYLGLSSALHLSCIPGLHSHCSHPQSSHSVLLFGTFKTALLQSYLCLEFSEGRKTVS